MNFQRIRENSILITVFLAFVLVRVFSPNPYCFISMDEAKYLVLARNFPHYTLFNNQLYVVHPPLFPYLIRFFSLALPDHIAGITISFLSALVTFWVTVRLLRLFGKDRYWMTVALFVLTVSPLHISASRVIYKDSMYLGLFLLSLCCFLKGLVAPNRGSLVAAGIWGAACCLTWDLGVLLLPCWAAGYFIFKKPVTRWRDVIPAPLIMLVFYGTWLAVRYSVFRDNLYYPVGVDGTLEYVHDFGLRHLFTPRYFPYTMTMFNFTVDFSEFRINANIYDLSFLIRLPPFFAAAFYLFVGATALFTLIQGIRRNELKDNPAAFFSIMLIIFALPVTLHPEPRFLLPILLPMSYLFAHGLTSLIKQARGSFPVLRTIAAALAFVLALLAIKNLAGPAHLIFAVKKEVESPHTARFLKSLPADGVMAQIGYPPELIYLTGKRVVGLPVYPEVLDYFIQLYDVHYLLYGQHYLAPLSTRDGTLIWCYSTIKHIQQHPEKYPLLKTIREDYRARQWPDLIFIHGVRRAR